METQETLEFLSSHGHTECPVTDGTISSERNAEYSYIYGD